MRIVAHLLALATAEIRLFVPRAPSAFPDSLAAISGPSGSSAPLERVPVLTAPLPQPPARNTDAPWLFAAAGFGAAALAAAASASAVARAARPRSPPCRAALPKSADEVVALADSVVVDIDIAPAQSLGGIFLPSVYMEESTQDEAFVQQEPRRGTVLSVGPDAVSLAGQKIAVGDEVVVGPHKGQKVVIEGIGLSESRVFLFSADQVWGVC